MTTTTTTRTKIDSSQYGEVTLTWDEPGLTDGPETTTYFVRRDGKVGYVKIRDDAGRFPQVCERLSTRGSTLMATADTLEKVIRTELRRARDAARRERARW